MRNDEKIDIDLSQDLEEASSKEEQIQQDYETAMRYVNIAEHMKKFEDQVKYYHKAVFYLKKVKPYDKSVAPLIKKYRFCKYTARAEGKVALYEQACQIRDHAKTPSDFYSAQIVFERIHKYTDGKSLPEKYVESKEIYDKAVKYDDSEQQAAYCEDKANELAAKQKRHSLITSILVILVLLAFLAFTRTVAFKSVLGDINQLIGNYSYAWECKQYVYNHDHSENAHKSYLINRYKAAVKEAKQKDYANAAKDFQAVAKENYKDSGDRLVQVEKKMVENTQLGEQVDFAGMTWRLLSKDSSRALLLKDESISDIPFAKKGSKDTTWENSYARAWLNGTFLKENFVDLEKDMVVDSKLATKKSYAGKDMTITEDKVFLLSQKEFKQYHEYIHPTQNCWWLRTPGTNPNSSQFVYTDKNRTLMPFGYEVTGSAFKIKPAVWVHLK
ncbi:MAG: DUF6273 domain-containing protein [Lachnospiraceae bacterium]|nr:DUF6273 domain-containing protein [Lachnospiraceae bacterium]